MATINVRDIVSNCLGKSGELSLLRDVLGVYGTDNPQTRSVKERLNLIQNSTFVRVALVTIQGATPTIQRDLDNANLIYQSECNRWVYCQGSTTVNSTTANLLTLDQDDCSVSGHEVSNEENDLFNIGRNMGADVVCYYINSDTANHAGCAAHPPGRRGFWVGASSSPWTFAHELTHVVGDNRHITDSDDLMFTPTGNITNPPPDLTDNQCNRIGNDVDMESCS